MTIYGYLYRGPNGARTGLCRRKRELGKYFTTCEDKRERKRVLLHMSVSICNNRGRDPLLVLTKFDYTDQAHHGRCMRCCHLSKHRQTDRCATRIIAAKRRERGTDHYDATEIILVVQYDVHAAAVLFQRENVQCCCCCCFFSLYALVAIFQFQ